MPHVAHTTFACGLQGLEVKEHMRDIPQHCDPAPIIRIYVDLNLQTLHKAGVISGPMPPTAGAVPEPTLPPTSSGIAQAERGSSAPLGRMQSAGGSSGQLTQTVQEENRGKAASGVAETSPLSSAGSMASPGSQASCVLLNLTSQSWRESAYNVMMDSIPLTASWSAISGCHMQWAVYRFARLSCCGRIAYLAYTPFAVS